MWKWFTSFSLEELPYFKYLFLFSDRQSELEVLVGRMVRRRRSEFWISGNDIDDEGRWEWAKTGHQEVCKQLSWSVVCLSGDGIELFYEFKPLKIWLLTSRLVPGVGWRSPTTPLRRTAWRGACLPPPPSPPPRSGTGPPAAITCSTSASLSDLYLIINLMALETICIEKVFTSSNSSFPVSSNQSGNGASWMV